jgi:hypothetical protein
VTRTSGISNGIRHQRLAPLLLVALLLLVCGTFVALDDPLGRSSSEESVGSKLESLKSVAVPIDLDEATGVDLRPIAEGGRFRARLRETLLLASNHRRTSSLELIVVDRPWVEASPAGPNDTTAKETTFRRTFEEVDIDIESDGDSVGSAITDEVERLVSATSYRVSYDVTGALVDYEVVSREAAQLAQLLSVMEGSFRWLSPHVPRSEVNSGESWSYSVFPRDSARSGLGQIESRFAGIDAAGRVHLDQSLLAMDAGNSDRTTNGSAAPLGSGHVVMAPKTTEVGQGRYRVERVSYDWTQRTGGVGAVRAEFQLRWERLEAAAR